MAGGSSQQLQSVVQQKGLLFFFLFFFSVFSSCKKQKLEKANCGREVCDLRTDLSDGVCLLHIVAQLFALVPVPRHTASPQTEVHRLDNLALALRVLESNNVRLEVSNKQPPKRKKKKSCCCLTLSFLVYHCPCFAGRTSTGSDGTDLDAH